MIKISSIRYTPFFIEQFKELPQELQKIFVEKEQQFRENLSDFSLNGHQFKRNVKHIYTFSVTPKYRVVYCFEDEDIVTFVKIDTSAQIPSFTQQPWRSILRSL